MNRFEDVARYLLTKGADASIEMPAPEAIADAMLKSFVKGKSPGIAVLAAQNGKILFQRGYGYACLAHDVPVSPETKFRIGSVTKQFTAAAVLLLAEEGLVDLDADFTEYVDFDTGGRTIPVRRLLDHTSGIESYTDMPATPLFPFGHGLSYTTFGYRDVRVPAQVPAGDTVHVTVEVENTGSRDGEEERDDPGARATPPAG